LGGVVRSPKDFWLGVIYALVGAVILLLLIGLIKR